MISLRINVYYAQLSLFWFLAPVHNLFTTVNKHQASTCCLANNSTNLPVHSDEDFSLFAIVKCQSGWDYGLGGVSVWHGRQSLQRCSWAPVISLWKWDDGKPSP